MKKNNMIHIKTFESYNSRLDDILDKINKSGKSSLTQSELEYLNAYSTDDFGKMDYIDKIEGQRTFNSSDGYFRFKYEYTEDYGDEVFYYGILYVPDLEWPNGKRITGELEGYIAVYPSKQIAPVFEKDGYDVLEFCNGLEYELDSFLEYVIDTIEDEKMGSDI